MNNYKLGLGGEDVDDYNNSSLRQVHIHASNSNGGTMPHVGHGHGQHSRMWGYYGNNSDNNNKTDDYWSSFWGFLVCLFFFIILLFAISYPATYYYWHDDDMRDSNYGRVHHIHYQNCIGC